MNAWLCCRCGAATREDGGNQRDGSLPPDGWRQMHVPVRGSEGARSARLDVICDVCDDALYEWLHEGAVMNGERLESYDVLLAVLAVAAILALLFADDAKCSITVRSTDTTELAHVPDGVVL